MEHPNEKKTRIAPTPSGYLHIGNCYSFAVTWLIAQQYGAKILLRIDDLDSMRMRKEYVDDIFFTLDFAGLTPDDGPSGTEDFLKNYSQHTRLHLYARHLETLAERNRVYACSCSRKDLSSLCGGYSGICRDKMHPLDGQDLSWRLKTDNTAVSYTELAHGVREAFLPPEMREPVVRKKDGLPSYQLASVADDIHFGINIIVRGQDLLPSTLAQQLIAASLELSLFSKTGFFHHTIIQQHGKKISKSQNAPSVRSQFATRTDLLTSIAAMIGIDQKIASLDELYDAAAMKKCIDSLSIVHDPNP
jgi:glutamyl-tRNA synthetase